MMTDTAQACGNCKWANGISDIYVWLQCTAPVPASATRDDLNYMAPDDGKDCSTWHAK